MKEKDDDEVGPVGYWIRDSIPPFVPIPPPVDKYGKDQNKMPNTLK